MIASGRIVIACCAVVFFARKAGKVDIVVGEVRIIANSVSDTSRCLNPYSNYRLIKRLWSFENDIETFLMVDFLRTNLHR